MNRHLCNVTCDCLMIVFMYICIAMSYVLKWGYTTYVYMHMHLFITQYAECYFRLKRFLIDINMRIDSYRMVGMKCRERIGRIYCGANIGSSNFVLFMEQSSVSSQVCSVKGMKTELNQMRLHSKFAQKLGRFFRIRSFTVRESNPGRSLQLFMLG